MRKFVILIITLTAISCGTKKQETAIISKFYKVEGKEIIAPDGSKFFIKGTNLGNWLNPEGYMFLFEHVSSARLIDQLFKEMVGEDFTNQFWAEFKRNYVTQADIAYLKSTGMNSVRLPFHYKLFTDEDYMGVTGEQNGFQYIDSLVKWCKAEDMAIILDMHDAPGGQTGDNIDDSYGYPWLLTNDNDQRKCAEIWKSIAQRYRNEPQIIGYDLLNEPIAHYFTEELDSLNSLLEPLYHRIADSIRSVDTNHILFLGGAQWNGNMDIFGKPFDENVVYTVHRYWSDTTQASIQSWIEFRDKMNKPLYIGETGENTDQWVESFRKLMERNDIGWHFWPYKKMDNTRGIVYFEQPVNYDLILEYTRAPRHHFGEIRAARPPQKQVRAAMKELMQNIKYENCVKNNGYIQALGLQP